MFGKKVKFSFSKMDESGWLHFKTDDGRIVSVAYQEVEYALFYFGKYALRNLLQRKLKELEEQKSKDELLSKFILQGENWF